MPVSLLLCEGIASSPDMRVLGKLLAARDRLTFYQTARAALSDRRRRFTPLSCSFGRERGREGHPLPEDTTEAACREGIRGCVGAYNAEQSVTVEEVTAAFDMLMPEFRVEDARYDHYLAAFAGKDILWAMDAEIRGFDFDGVLPFREKVLIGIQNSTDDIGDWLPEWKALQRAVENS